MNHNANDTTRGKTRDFEAQLNELEEIVRRLESADQPLEASLADFERGVRLALECSEALNAMERRVELLTVSEEGEIAREPFDPRAGGDSDENEDAGG